MSMRLFAVLFVALFVIGAFPIFFIQPFGSASAGITAGFVVPIESVSGVIILVSLGLIGAWAGREAVLALPLSALLMVTIGALTQIRIQDHPAVHSFVLGSIILFALCLSMVRHKSFLIWVIPVSVWSYFSGSRVMEHIPSITTPFFFLMGVIVSNALILAIGVALGVAIADNMHASVERLKKSSAALATFLSLF